MLKKLLIIVIFISMFSGCSQATLYIPTLINQPQEIKIAILPVEDKTQKYDKSIDLDALLEESNELSPTQGSGYHVASPVLGNTR